MAASTVVRWVKVLVALVAVGLMLFGVVAILVGLLGRLSTGTGGLVPDGPAPTASVAAGDPVKVVSVPDGDTIVVRVGEGTERVRVIGLDTPEIGSEECFAVGLPARRGRWCRAGPCCCRPTRRRMTATDTAGCCGT